MAKKLISEININNNGTARIIELAKSLNCDAYMIFDFESRFIDSTKLKNAGIELRILKPHIRQYRQQYNSFEPNLSIIDLLFNMGNESMDYLYN